MLLDDLIVRTAGGIASDGGLRFSAIERSEAGAVTLTWTSQPGKTYGIDSSTDLVNWVEIDAAARRAARLRMPFLKEERPHLILRELQRVLAEQTAPRY